MPPPPAESIATLLVELLPEEITLGGLLRTETLTVDLPIEHGLDSLCDALDEQVIGAGGRVYLAKDSRLSAAAFRQMYPRLDDFLAVRREVDPSGLFNSDLARRLEIR